jgi:hypothetical protein
MADVRVEADSARRLTLADWPPQFERDLGRIGLPDREEHARARTLLFFRLHDMERNQKILDDAHQEGKLGNYRMFSVQWAVRRYRVPRVNVWFTLGDGRLTAILAYSHAANVAGVGERALAIERARAIHGIADVTMTETE